MIKRRTALRLAAAASFTVLVGGQASALPARVGATSDHGLSNIETVAKRCRYDRHGRLHCRKAKRYPQRRYYYNPYAAYSFSYDYYYPRIYGFGHHHHGFSHGHHHGHH